MAERRDRFPFPDYPGPGPDITDDEVLTQYGWRVGMDLPVYRSKPRYPAEYELSMIRGAVSIERAALLVRRRPAEPGDVVRYTTAGKLRALGFRVMSTPTLRNRDHVSVVVPRGHVEWNDEQEFAFVRAFDVAEEVGERGDDD